MTLVIANYYSILFYISEIWYIPSLTCRTKIQLMRASVNPLKFVVLLMTCQYHMNASTVSHTDPTHTHLRNTYMHFYFTKFTIRTSKIKIGQTFFSISNLMIDFRRLAFLTRADTNKARIF